MAGKGIIEHKGIIDHTEGNTAFVKIYAQSACASCKLNGICSGDTKEKIIEVNNINNEYHTRDEVMVSITEKLGYKALFLGYLLPFIIVFLSLIILDITTGKQGLSGIIAVLSLVPYYLILSQFKHKIKKAFQFNLNKIHQ
jgi:positive regulator of sigma E activity